MLSPSEIQERLSYSSETGCFTWKQPGKKVVVGARAGTVKPHGYEVIGLGYDQHYSHRLAWLFMTGAWPIGQVDHINGDRADNRFANLRLASHAENQRNRGLQRNNQSGTAGVHWAARESRWIAKIKLNGKTAQIGIFTSRNAAIAARKAAEQAMFGKFTRNGDET